MELSQLADRALEIRKLYNELETRQFGQAWTQKDIMIGFVGDVGDLAKLVMAKEGVRAIVDVDEKLAHELADCLWAILVLSKMYGVDLETEFVGTMSQLEQSIKVSLNET